LNEWGKDEDFKEVTERYCLGGVQALIWCCVVESGGEKPTGMWCVHHMVRVDPVYSLTTVKYNALIFLQFNTTYPVI
jgi:hypothetical protein